MNDLHRSGVAWFTLKEPTLVEQVHYPLTTVDKAWNDTLLVLAKLVIEGLEQKYFVKVAKSRGVDGDPTWRSIRWIQEAMNAAGMNGEIVDEVTLPLRTLQDLRTKFGAHSGGKEAANMRAALIRKHKTPRLHIEHLSDQLLRSLNHVRNLVELGHMNHLGDTSKRSDYSS